MKWLELKIPPVLIPAFSVCLMYLTRNSLPRFSFPNDFMFFVAGFVFFTACVFMFLGVYEFKKAQTTVNPIQIEGTSKLVDKGVYRVSRNPMYLGFVLTVGAAGLALQYSLFIIFCLLTLTFIQLFQIKPEERMLEEKFGDEYTHYCRKVARWF